MENAKIVESLRKQAQKWCRNCFYFAADKPCETECDTKALRDAADLIESFINQPATDSDAGGTWISVEDKLPADHQRVLVSGPHGGIQICGFSEKGFLGKYEFWTHKQTTVKARYWMPLPTPPAKGGK